MPRDVDLYDSHYSHLSSDPQADVRRETYGEDLGQTSWITADELRESVKFLRLGPGQSALEVACGSGGVTCRLASDTGAACVGVDINVHAIAAANQRAASERLSQLVSFQVVDASRPLPFPDDSFDVIFCNDALNHIPGRSEAFQDWHRVLRSGGRLLFTDPVVVCGPVTKEELRVRSSIGFFLFSPFGYNERQLRHTGFSVLDVRDTSNAAASVSKKWRDARARRREQLVAQEGEENFEGLQRFLDAVHRLTSERRLSRYTYFASKP